MRQIAEQSGIALGGIYNHFSSKDDIFQAVIIAHHPYLRIFPALKEAPGDSTEEFIRNAARAVQDDIGRHPDFIKLMFIEIVEFNGRHFPKLYELIFPMALPLLQRFAMPDNGVRTIPLPKLVRIFMATILGFYVTGFLLNAPELPDEMRVMDLEDFFDVFMFGIFERDRK
jgi:AcrR family transcriptional regulator